MSGAGARAAPDWRSARWFAADIIAGHSLGLLAAGWTAGYTGSGLALDGTGASATDRLVDRQAWAPPSAALRAAAPLLTGRAGGAEVLAPQMR